MIDLEVMKLESKTDEMNAKMVYAAALIKKVRYELDKEMTDEKVKELKNYVSDISDFLISN